MGAKLDPPPRDIALDRKAVYSTKVQKYVLIEDPVQDLSLPEPESMTSS